MKPPRFPFSIRRSDFRDPPYAWRVFFVAAALSLPGIIAGMILALFGGNIWVLAVVGGLIGAAYGASIEALPASRAKTHREHWRRRSDAVFDAPWNAVETPPLERR
jgi:hypothetical protein